MLWCATEAKNGGSVRRGSAEDYGTKSRYDSAADAFRASMPRLIAADCPVWRVYEFFVPTVCIAGFRVVLDLFPDHQWAFLCRSTPRHCRFPHLHSFASPSMEPQLGSVA